MSAAFHDHFSAASRPTYADALYRFVASVAPATERAWDCASRRVTMPLHFLCGRLRGG